ncbi:VOC family protein [Paenibacillus sp. WQ 127069]|uniref:VOC family protein n=1 Tax=Paenibacillus baimaensis TaxID=2982185 RepID=A0ABT2UAX9_9BACL|nr:VOC family protein [Paenibacillus sp. WQ 127069]MCU6791794.1 VOC family protein [Paenibacillus sp. WQ 127069]
MSSLIPNPVIAQIAILVNDIDKVSQAYANFFGVEKPPIKITDTADKTQVEYQGKSTQARIKMAFFQMSNLQLELIEPDEHPSTWRDHLNKYGEGPHHIAFMVEGMKEKISLFESNAFPLQQKGEYTGGRYAYFNTMNELKVVIELLENDRNEA